MEPEKEIKELEKPQTLDEIVSDYRKRISDATDLQTLEKILNDLSGENFYRESNKGLIKINPTVYLAETLLAALKTKVSEKALMVSYLDNNKVVASGLNEELAWKEIKEFFRGLSWELHGCPYGNLATLAGNFLRTATTAFSAWHKSSC